MGCHALFQRIFLTQDRTCVSCIAGGVFTAELSGKYQYLLLSLHKSIASSHHAPDPWIVLPPAQGTRFPFLRLLESVQPPYPESLHDQVLETRDDFVVHSPLKLLRNHPVLAKHTQLLTLPCPFPHENHSKGCDPPLSWFCLLLLPPS